MEFACRLQPFSVKPSPAPWSSIVSVQLPFGFSPMKAARPPSGDMDGRVWTWPPPTPHVPSVAVTEIGAVSFHVVVSAFWDPLPRPLLITTVVPCGEVSVIRSSEGSRLWVMFVRRSRSVR